MSVSRSAPAAPLSVLVLTYNEEPNIRTCLSTVVGWADQVIVVDSGSSDRTVTICLELGVTVIAHPYLDHRTQIDWALRSVPWTYDWLLLLDADNQVSERLKDDIRRILDNDKGSMHGYYNPHHHYFRNHRVFGLKQDWLRLVRRSRASVDASELVDFRIAVDGPTGALSGEIVESNQKELDIDFWIDKHQHFAARMAIEEILRRDGIVKWATSLRPSPFGNPDERMIWLKNLWYRLPLVVRPLLFFIYRYILRGGFLGGWNGFIYHFLEALWFRIVVDLKISEYRTRMTHGNLSVDNLLDSTSISPGVRPVQT